MAMEMINELKKSPISLKGNKMLYSTDLKEHRLKGIFAKLETLDFDCTQATKHFGEVAKSMLYMAGGLLDDAHNVVTPLSWPIPTYCGAPIIGSPAKNDASYAHALVHLLEGPVVGEYGTGWNNAGYWYSSIRGNHPVFDKILKAGKELAKEFKSPAVKKFIRAQSKRWNPQAFVSLAEDAVARRDRDVVTFAETLASEEITLLFKHCIAQTKQSTL